MTQANPGLELPRPPLARLLRLLSCIRFDEVCVLQGAPLLGALFALPAFTADSLLRLAALVAANICLVAHVFLLNDWAGIAGDRRDPTRAGWTFEAKGVSRRAVGALAFGLLAASLLILGLIGTEALALGSVIAVLSSLYSAPSTHWKSAPLLGSALHLGGGALHFLLGYASFGPLDGRAVAVSAFFALVFTAGHLSNEARDYEGDAANRLRTNAVVFGRTSIFLTGLALFTAAYGLLVALALLGRVPELFVLAGALYPLHLAASLRALRAGLSFSRLRQLQWIYRAIYALIGLAMIATVPPW